MLAQPSQPYTLSLGGVLSFALPSAIYIHIYIYIYVYI